MTAGVLLAQDVWVAYGQIYLVSSTDEAGSTMEDAFRGQSNGICGAAVPGGLFLMTGTHTGRVGFTVELHHREPPLDNRWQEAVEVSFTAGGGDVGLAEWGGQGWHPLSIPAGDYRVRYCALGMDDGHQGGGPEDGQPPHDHYLLQLWPAGPGTDRVVRQTTELAAYWRLWARDLPPAPTPQEIAEVTRQHRLAQQAQEAAWQADADRHRWGNRAPNDRLRHVGGNVRAMEQLDLPLVFDLSETSDATLRTLALWAAERAYEAAGLTALPWAAPALAALRQGRPLPPPFDDPGAPWPHLDTTPITTVRSYDGRHERISQQHAAVPALLGAAEPDALQAALDALFAAVVTYGDRYPNLLAALKKEFPEGWCRPGKT
jgi:hypothetical protein